MISWYTGCASLFRQSGRHFNKVTSEVTFKRAVTDPKAALAVAGRRAAAQFPQLPVAEALARWADGVLATWEPEPVAAAPVLAATSLAADLLMDLAISGGCSCVMWGSDRGVQRRPGDEDRRVHRVGAQNMEARNCSRWWTP